MLAMMLLLGLLGCEDFFITEAGDPYMNNFRQRLVVYSYISPQDTLIRVFVERSTTYGQNPLGQQLGGQADVFMGKKGGPLKQLAWMPDRYYFAIDPREIGIEAGEHYVLKVESHAGEKVEAECRVPEMDFTGFEMHPPRFYGDPNYSPQFVLNWSFRAPDNGLERYYSSGGYRKIYQLRYRNQTYDTVFAGIAPYYLQRGQEFVAGNKAASFSFGITDYYDPKRPDSSFIYVLQTDEHYYRFHKTVSEAVHHPDDSPFAQAVNIYSNIRGGLGVFAGYNRRDYYAGF